MCVSTQKGVRMKTFQQILLFVSCLWAAPLASQSFLLKNKTIQFDFQGDHHYSQYNFTDLKNPYSGTDGWTEIKIAYWLTNSRIFAPYFSAIPIYTTEDEFWWQRNVELRVGVQWYPFAFSVPHVRAIRLFAQFGRKAYYDEPAGQSALKNDLQIGADYYFDNIFADTPFNIIAWSNLAWRRTNFALDDFKTVLWTGNLKLGTNIKPGNSIIIPYFVAEWTAVPEYRERWWENFLRLGGGLRWYIAATQGDNILSKLTRRFHIYFEVLNNAKWLQDVPQVSVQETDYRFGVGFSTSGFLREKFK